MWDLGHKRDDCGYFIILISLAGLPEALLYVRHITSADAFPGTVVEEEDIVAIDAGDLVAVLVHGVPPCALFDTETAVSEHCRKLV